MKRITGWRCEEEAKTDRGGAFNGDCCDPACRLYAVERDSISRIEIGTRFVSDFELKVFAKALGVSVDWLLGNE